VINQIKSNQFTSGSEANKQSHNDTERKAVGRQSKNITETY